MRPVPGQRPGECAVELIRSLPADFARQPHPPLVGLDEPPPRSVIEPHVGDLERGSRSSDALGCRSWAGQQREPLGDVLLDLAERKGHGRSLLEGAGRSTSWRLEDAVKNVWRETSRVLNEVPDG